MYDDTRTKLLYKVRGKSKNAVRPAITEPSLDMFDMTTSTKFGSFRHNFWSSNRMLHLLPYDILIIVYKQLCFIDRKNLTDASKALRLHFIYERYKYLVIDRDHCVPGSLDLQYYDIGFYQSGDSKRFDRLFIPSDAYSNLDGLLSYTPLWPLESINVMIHWSGDKAESVIKLMKQLKKWNIRLNLQLIQHNLQPRFEDVVRLDVAFHLFSCTRLTRTLYGLLIKACFSDGKVSKLRFSVPVKVNDLREEEFKLPGDIYEVEFTSSGLYNHVNTHVLRYILNANFRSNIRKLSIEGHRDRERPSGQPLQLVGKIVLPPSVTNLNYYLFNNSSMAVCSRNVRHLSFKPYPEAKSVDEYATVFAYLDRIGYIPNLRTGACYDIDIRLLNFCNAIVSTVVYETRMRFNRRRYMDMSDNDSTCLWGINKNRLCNHPNVDVVQILYGGIRHQRSRLALSI